MPPQPVILESQTATSVADGATIAREFASANPTKGEEDARVQERGIRAKILSTHAATYNTFNVQRHLTSATTHRAFRTSAMQAWREVVAAA